MLFGLSCRSVAADLDLYYLHDAQGDKSLAQISGLFDAAGTSKRWRAGQDGRGGQHWFRLNITGDKIGPGADTLKINFANIDVVDVWVSYDGVPAQHYRLGDEVAFSDWPIRYRTPSIPLTQLNNSDATVFFRVVSDTPIVLPLALTSSAQIQSDQLFEHLFFGAFFGAILMLSMYNLGLYFSLRDKSYLFYVIYILAFAFVQLTTTGLGQQYIWPDSDGLTTKIAYLAIAITNFAILHFALYFIHVRKHKPRLFIVMRVSAYLVFFPLVLLLFTGYGPVQILLDLLTFANIVLIVYAAFSILRQEFRPAVYLLISYSILFSSIILAILRNAGVFGSEFIADYLMSIAIIVEAVILSVGLSERIAILRIENERAERERRLAQQGFSRQLMEVREREKSAMSKLLHDSVNHDLLVLRNRLLKIAGDADDDSALRISMASSASNLDGVIDTIRDISHANYPPLLKHLGLQQSLQILLSNAFPHSVEWHVHVDPNHLSFEGQLFIYRATQECVSNILRHARASECLVNLKVENRQGEEWVTLTVKDDGQGLDSRKDFGFGLSTLRDGSEALGGKFSIKSERNIGSEVTILLPSSYSEHGYAWKDTITGG